MQTNPLRVEFVLTGLAAIFAITGLAEVVHWRCEGATFNTIDWAGSSALSRLPAFFLLIAVAYIVGIVVVQATFFFPTQYLIGRVRNERWNDLSAVDAKLQKGSSIDRSDDLLTMAFRGTVAEISPWKYLQFWKEKEELSVDHHAQSLVLTLGRSLAHPELADEYRYRRSNRQIFVGILPAFAFASLAGLMWTTSLSLPVGVPLTLVIMLLTIGCFWVLWESALYQERVAQSLILDVAFLHRWGSWGEVSDAGSAS